MTRVASEVSVVIPCYRQGHLVANAIDSVLVQDAVKVEVVLVDDGSPDETREVARAYGQRIRYLRTENGGLARARNVGIANASAELLVFLDADDLLSGEWLMHQVRNARTHPDIDVFCSGWREIDIDGALATQFAAPRFEPDPFHRYLRSNAAPIHAHMARSRAVRLVRGFDSCVAALADWDFWLRVSAAGCRFLATNECAVDYRRYPGSMSTNPLVMQRERRVVYRKHKRVHSGCALCRELVTEPLHADRLGEARVLVQGLWSARGRFDLARLVGDCWSSLRADPGIMAAVMAHLPATVIRMFVRGSR